MPCRVHHHINAGDEEETIISIERPRPNTRGLTKPAKFSPERILVRVHVGHSTEIDKQGIAVLHAQHHAVDRQARRRVRRQVSHGTMRNLRRALPMEAQVDELRSRCGFAG